LISIGYQVKGQDLYTIDNSWKFANYLVTAGEYDMASGELERLVFIDSTNIQAKLLLIKSYRLQRKYHTGIKKTNEFFNSYDQIPSGFALEYGKMLISSEQYNETEKFLAVNNNLLRKEKAFLQISNKMLSEDFAAASNLAVQYRDINSRFIISYTNLLNKENEFNYKKPGISMALSSIIPGSGKMYCGYWKDGIISLLFVAASAYQSYRGFSKHGIESVYGWIYGGVAAGFYFGNIYGSGKAANQYNSTFRHELHHQVENIYNSCE